MILLSCILLLILSGCLEKKGVRADKGIIDLSAWNPSTQKILELDGEWEFYWENLLEPADFKAQVALQKTGWMVLPDKWNGYSVKGSPLSGIGYATFRLRIKGCDPSKAYGLKILDMGTAYRLWVDGRLLMANGMVGTSKKETVSQYLPQTADFFSSSSTVELVLQVANFRHRKGGVWKSIEFGHAGDIKDKREWALGVQLFLFGSLLIMGLYHLGLYLIRPVDKSPLYFGIVSLITGFRSIATGERFLIWCFPDMNWELFQKIEYLTFYLGVPFFLKFIDSLFEEFSIRVANINVGVTLLFCLLTLFTPIAIYSHTVVWYEVMLIPFALYTLYTVVIAIMNNREGAKWVMIGLLVLFATVANDVLAANELVPPVYLVSFGLFVFIFAQSFMLSIRFSNAFKAVETISKKLSRAERKYRSVFENAVEGIFLATLNGKLLSANPAFFEIFGYQSVYDFDADKTDLNKLWQNDNKGQAKAFSLLETQGYIKDFELATHRKNGDPIEISANIHAVKDDQQNIQYVEGIIEDVTIKKTSEKLKIAKESAELANRLKSEFLATISHELRTPMHGVLGFANLGRSKAHNADRSKILKFFDEIVKCGNTLMNLLNDLLDLSKLESGKVAYQLSEHKLSSAVTAVIDELEALTGEKRIKIRFKAPVGEIQLQFDMQKIMQVIRNLLSNATKFSNPEDCIDIELQDQKEYLLLSVRDYGTGIPKDELESVFDQYIQSSKTKSGAGGTGLGLAISKRIIEDHHGEIWAEQNADQGVTFKFKIPVTGPQYDS